MNPILSNFNKKYKAIIQSYLWGMCSAQQMLDAIELVDKYFA